MYNDLRAFGISNKEAASTLLSARVSAGGMAPRDRVQSKTYLSREVVHARPGSVDPYLFADFHTSVLTLTARILRRAGSREAVVSHYAGDALPKMAATLELFGLQGQIVLNETARLSGAKLLREEDRPTLLVMLFCATGCLADPKAAVEVVEEYARHRLAQDLATFSIGLEEQSEGSSHGILGLIRIEDDVVTSQLMPLDPTGTIVGALAAGPSSICDVGMDVSRRHLRIWREDGRWLCEGLGSTNGTTIEGGGEGRPITCVEPARTARRPGLSYPPQELHEGDVLVLGKSTRFLAMRTRER